jgi:hypothetical protein
MKTFTLLSGLSGKQIETTQLEVILQKCLDDITNLPEFSELKLLNEPKIVCEKFKSTVLSEQKEVHKKIEEIRENLTRGKYDEMMFSENPTLTEELKIALSKYSTDIVEILFTKCKSDKVLRFWLDEQKMTLPSDTWALAVNLGVNIVVLKYLKEKGFFDGLSKEDKEELLDCAKRFPGEGLSYLKEEFSEKNNKLTL